MIAAGWYVVAGVAATLAQLLLFLLLRTPLGSHGANIVAIVLTTLANTEFHRRVTFAGLPDHPVRRATQTVLTIAFYAGYGSVVLLLLDWLTVPTPELETLALAAASLLGGTIRFVALRWWVFARPRRQPADVSR
ncbi:GtrA family protein [Amycolatopsis suaedae]|uniref:GtrA family protein n=1 Tax=Amycolatopsis suaedae TaxID=2510978 RepID=A0A4V2EL81_9PSEU|nr:GtrA family protein [Amycolatopsis suaedae]RZQ60645.1 GtrA family protein [Amycolatopsis suaedae]